MPNDIYYYLYIIPLSQHIIDFLVVFIKFGSKLHKLLFHSRYFFGDSFFLRLNTTQLFHELYTIRDFATICIHKTFNVNVIYSSNSFHCCRSGILSSPFLDLHI